MIAALGRRVFVAGPAPESVDYAHRTTAEYLGAAWLADAVRNGHAVRPAASANGDQTGILRLNCAGCTRGWPCIFLNMPIGSSTLIHTAS